VAPVVAKPEPAFQLIVTLFHIVTVCGVSQLESPLVTCVLVAGRPYYIPCTIGVGSGASGSSTTRR
jgi:hypothetical protein